MKYIEKMHGVTCWICIVFMMSFLTACKTTGGGVHVGWENDPEKTHPSNEPRYEVKGPPPHAPAHGYRAKYTYRYYPASRVYYDTSRKLYFYCKSENWSVAVSLPDDIFCDSRDYVTIAMDTDKPYVQNDDHRKKYPPGQLKEQNNKKWSKY